MSATLKLRDRYDWIVLGDHPSALLSAALVARLGLSVLVLDFIPRAKPMVSKNGQVLDPEVNFLLGLNASGPETGLLGECLHRLGMAPSELEYLRSSDCLPQFVTPDLRFSLRRSGSDFEKELIRELGDSRVDVRAAMEALERIFPKVISFWKGLPGRLTLAPDKRKVKEGGGEPTELEQVMKSAAADAPDSLKGWLSGRAVPGLEDLSALFLGLIRSLAPESSESREDTLILPFLSLGRTGAAYRGGLSAYREFLLNLARRMGAHVPEKTDCRRIFVEDGALVGIQVTQRNSVIGAGGAVIGCSLDHIRDFVAFSGRKWMHRLSEPPTPDSWRFTLALTVQAEAIPPGVLSRVVWREEGAPALDIEIAQPEDYGIAEPHHRVIFLRTLLPFREESLAPEYQKLVASRMFRQLIEIMPFLEFHVVRIFPDFRSDSFQDFSQVYDFDSVRMIPANLRMGFRGGVGSRSGVEGLFVATDESFPQLGNFGGTVAALESAAWIAHRCGVAGPLV